MIAILMTAPTAVAPVKSTIAGLFRADDYPGVMARNGEQGGVALTMLVEPDGKVEKCTVFASSGHKDLDSYTCDVVKLRARFPEVADQDGKAVYGLYNTIVSWSLDVPRRYVLPADLELAIDHAPGGVQLPLQFKVAYMYGIDGAISGCRLAPEASPEPRELVDIACQSFAGGPKQIIRNSKGQAVEAWTVSTVRYTQGAVSRSTVPWPASP